MEDTDKTEGRRSVSPTMEIPNLTILNNSNDKKKHLRETSLHFANEADMMCKKLKRSCDQLSKYWGDIALVHELRGASKLNELEYEQEAYVDEGGKLEDFLGLEKTTQIKDAIKAHERLRNLYYKQQSRLNSSSSASRAFMALYTTSRRGLDVKAGTGSRARKDQREFHKTLTNYYQLEDITDKTKQGLMWSVVVGDWVTRQTLKAAHIYPYSWGQQRMIELFGEECSDELLSARNGLMLPLCIEEAMADWAIVIVPDNEDKPTTKPAKESTQSAPCEYKFRILNPEHPSLEVVMLSLGGDPLRGKDLDQVRLKFRTELRPRARYLWLWFACAVLRQFWQKDPRSAPPTLEPQLGKGMWGTQGAYLRKDFILGLIEEIGHEGSFLVDGAKPAHLADDDIPNEALVDLVNQEITSEADKEADAQDYVENIWYGSEYEYEEYEYEEYEYEKDEEE